MLAGFHVLHFKILKFENFGRVLLRHGALHGPASYMSSHKGEDFEEQQAGMRKWVKQMVEIINSQSG